MKRVHEDFTPFTRNLGILTPTTDVNHSFNHYVGINL